eukprot:4912471-Amphidinium_carterae.2
MRLEEPESKRQKPDVAGVEGDFEVPEEEAASADHQEDQRLAAQEAASAVQEEEEEEEDIDDSREVYQRVPLRECHERTNKKRVIQLDASTGCHQNFVQPVHVTGLVTTREATCGTSAAHTSTETRRKTFTSSFHQKMRAKRATQNRCAVCCLEACTGRKTHPRYGNETTLSFWVASSGNKVRLEPCSTRRSHKRESSARRRLPALGDEDVQQMDETLRSRQVRGSNPRVELEHDMRHIDYLMRDFGLDGIKFKKALDCPSVKVGMQDVQRKSDETALETAECTRTCD